MYRNILKFSFVVATKKKCVIWFYPLRIDAVTTHTKKTNHNKTSDIERIYMGS